jgi:predicted RNA-binding protein associated with RNAse of E/G family
MTDAPPFDTEWEQTHVLRFERAGARHSIEIYWRTDWEHWSWYVNLQSPVVVNGRFVDTTDEALDIVVAPDGGWRWKDEDELAEGVELGIWSEEEAAEIRAEGERVVAAAPWPTGWEDWRPPEDWGPLGLPRDWHVV